MRDPRINPKPGDILKKDKDQRHVTRIDLKGVVGWDGKTLPIKVAYHNSTSKLGLIISIEDWGRWAKNTEIIRVESLT